MTRRFSTNSLCSTSRMCGRITRPSISITMAPGRTAISLGNLYAQQFSA
jgi:hypothetical protein